MSERVLITGGAGFVGSHLADRLLAEGYQVRALDNLAEQVHGQQSWPSYLDERIELRVGDLRNPEHVEDALRDVDAVFHLASAVGVGQSMYQIAHYVAVNNGGTAVLLQALSQRPVKKLVVASSMSLYGEGLYRDKGGDVRSVPERSAEQLMKGHWELEHDGKRLEPVATPEHKTAAPSSVYALSKFDQERLCLMVGAAYRIPTVALRFFNIYGPRQALSNPYTGVLAIFSARYLNNRSPVVFEDGQQRRDFVSVHDVAKACVLALESNAANNEIFNVGNGRNYSITDIAHKVADAVGKSHIPPQITGQYRVGDIRHCFADITKAREMLCYQPGVSLSDGLLELADWLKTQKAEDRMDQMRSELAGRGLSL